MGRGIPAVGVTGFEVLGAGAAWAVIDAPRGQVYVQGAGAARVMGADEVAGLDEPVRRMSDLSPAELAGRIAEVGFVKARVPQPRPAPFYLRGAEALPSTDPPVVILP